MPFRVKAHGSELEYSMRGRPQLEAWGAETLAAAEATYVGSGHIREVVDEVVGPLPSPVFEVPPGVDVEELVPEPRGGGARERSSTEARADPPNPGNANERLPDEGNAERLAAFLADGGPIVVYFGKLIVNKGVHLLLDAIRGLDVRAVVVGFGDYRRALEQQARTLPDGQTLFTGPLEHRHLGHLLPLAEASVVPSIFPEAFGMVAAEAASTGCPPLVARHSGLAEVAAGLEAEYPSGWTTSPRSSGRRRRPAGEARAPARAPRGRPRRGARRRQARGVAHWSWSSVAERLLAPVA